MSVRSVRRARRQRMGRTCMTAPPYQKAGGRIQKGRDRSSFRSGAAKCHLSFAARSTVSLANRLLPFAVGAGRKS